MTPDGSPQRVDLAGARAILGPTTPGPEALGAQDALWAAPGGYLLRRHLAFDSEVFGRPMARLMLATEALSLKASMLTALAGARDDYTHYVTTVPAEDDSTIWAFEAAGFRTVDVGVTFGWRPDPAHPPSPADGPRPATVADLDALRALAAELFRNSRFYRDDALEEAASNELHRRWIENCVRGRADVIWVSPSAAGAPVGFVTCRVVDGVGSIELVGVDPAHQGRGIARRLMMAALAWFAPRVREVRVKTQVTNYGAASLYLGMGFRLVASDVSLAMTLHP